MKCKCQCCGYNTIPGPKGMAIAYKCPVCYWETDTFIESDDEPSDQNKQLTLNEARENYKQKGACHEQFINKVRLPNELEKNFVK